MKKTNFILSALAGVGITVGLLGCGGDGVNPPLASQSQKVPERMVPTYAPSTGSIPLPNDLLFSGTADLTINVPGIDESDYSNPQLAISSLDGWSATAPFSIGFSSTDENLALDATSVVGGSSVRVFKVNVFRPDLNFGQVDGDGNPLPDSGIIVPSGPVTSVERELTSGLEYVVQATSATSIAIIPTVPFESQASYMVVLTNGLMDSDGLPLVHDSQYAIAQSQLALDPETTEGALEPVRQLVNAMETAASDYEGGPARSSIIESFQFTVQSIGNVMQTAKAVYIDGAIAAGATPATSFTSLGTDTSPFTGQASSVNLYAGQITLNYMLGIQSTENPTAPLNTFWRTAENVPNGQGGWVPNPAPLGNLTYANPLPQINGQETVPLLVSIPKSAQCPKPYPVTIFQHGITANRTNLIGIADSLGSACIAAVAMDMPLHGLAADDPTGLYVGVAPGGLRERTMGLDFIDNATGVAGPDGIADPSGTHTINLANLLVARDNNRQAIFDLLYLEKSIGFMDIDGDTTPDFDTDNISYIGHSLGGIVGSSFVAYSDNIKSAVLANPGGGVASLLNASLAFGPRIRDGIAAGAGIETTDAEFASVLAQFLFATQTVVDSSDPMGTAAIANANGVPTLMLQVAGDSVVPNSVATAPLSGTEPMARVLGLTTTAVGETNTVVGDRLFTKLNQGLHSTILSPADASGDPVGLINVTTEMQTETVSFIASGGTAVSVVDPTLLAQ